VFFARYDRFLDTSETAAHPLRLRLRHRAIVRDNAEILDGAHVLDIASHDGRWSFAAQHAGAAHTTGIEARAELVDNAVANFTHYGIPRTDSVSSTATRSTCCRLPITACGPTS
jgi:predicted RNA methylase